MDIKTAREEDLIDVLYLLKQEIATTCENPGCPPNPDYSQLREEIRQGTIYILEHHKISIGTFSVHQLQNGREKSEDGQTNRKHLQVNHLTIASYWINNDTIHEIISFLEKMANKHHVSALQLMVNRHNKKMNTFLGDLGFSLIGENSGKHGATPFNIFEKKRVEAS